MPDFTAKYFPCNATISIVLPAITIAIMLYSNVITAYHPITAQEGEVEKKEGAKRTSFCGY